MYLRGRGVPVNFIDAYMWFSIAKATPGRRAYQRASFYMERVEMGMTRAQIARAQSMAAAWAKAHGQ